MSRSLPTSAYWRKPHEHERRGAVALCAAPRDTMSRRDARPPCSLEAPEATAARAPRRPKRPRATFAYRSARSMCVSRNRPASAIAARASGRNAAQP